MTPIWSSVAGLNVAYCPMVVEPSVPNKPFRDGVAYILAPFEPNEHDIVPDGSSKTGPVPINAVPLRLYGAGR